MRFAPTAALILILAVPAGAEPLSQRFDRPVAVAGPDAALFDAAVLILVNQERRRAGLRPLGADAKLRQVSLTQAAAMAKARRMTHRLSEAKPARLSGRLDAAGVRYRRAGENIAMDKLFQLVGRPIALKREGCAFTYADDGAPVPIHSHGSLASSVVARWMASPGHRANILTASFRRTGAAAAVDPKGPACGDVYLVQAFAE